MKKFTLAAASFAAMLASPAAFGEVITYTFTNDTGADFSSYVSTTTLPIVINDIAASADGVNFTFDLTLTGTLNDGSAGAVFSNQRLRLSGDTTGVADSLTGVFTISDVQVVGAGTVDSINFISVDRFDNGGGDPWDVNGDTISATGNTVAITPSASLSVEAITDASNGNTRLEGFQLDVMTTVPEPSSLALVGLGIGMLSRRRRK